MPDHRAVLTLLSLLTVPTVNATAGPAAAIASEPDLSWYVVSLCPDDGIACTTAQAVYGECRHVPDQGACPDDGVFCNGEESCSPGQGGCVSSGPPCSGDTPHCDETGDRCLPDGVDDTVPVSSAQRHERPSGGPPTYHALRFDGVDDIVVAGESAALPLTTGFSLEAWVRPADDPRPGPGEVIAGKDGEFLLARKPDGTLEWALNLASSGFVFVDVAAARVPQAAWSHVALTYDGAHVRIYVNGTLVSAQAATGEIRRASAPVGLFRIGGRHDTGRGSGYFAGVIDDVRLWNVARSGDAIVAGMGRRLLGTEAGLIGYWHLDEGRGGAAADAARGNAGTLANGARWVDGRVSRVSTWL